MNSIEIPNNFFKTKWSKPSATTFNKRLTKCLTQQKYFRLLMSEIELHRDENKSKQEAEDKKSFFLI